MRRPSVSSLRSSWTYHSNAVRRWWRASLWNRLLVLSILIYGIVFSILTCLRILALSAFALDLGLYNQAFYSTVEYGRFFFVSGPPPTGGGSFFGGHFSPILILLLPVYALAPTPFTLVVVQTWIIAVGALPVYRLVQHLVKSDLVGFAFGLAYLMSPVTQGVNWFDFHTEAFLLPLLGAMLYSYERRNWKWLVVFALLTLSTIEMAAVLVGAFAVVILASDLFHWRWGHQALEPLRLSVILGVLSLCAGWLLIAGILVGVVNPGATYFSAGSDTWSILGAATPLSIPYQVLLHPDLALAALTFDGVSKVWYLIVLFAPFQLLTFRSPRATLLCIPWLGASMLSNFRPFYLVGNQYPAYVFPFIFYGAVVGLAQPWSPIPALRKLMHRRDLPGIPRPARAGYIRALVGMTLIFVIVVSPLGPWGIGADTTGGIPIVGSHDRAVLNLYGLVPGEASVLTQNNLYPLLSNRLNVHFVPLNVQFPAGASFNTTMNFWISTMDYILVDSVSSYAEAALVLSWPTVASSFSIVGAADGALLLERGSHSIEFNEPLVFSYEYNSVVLENGSVVADSQTSSGFALVHANLSTSHFWYGPFSSLPPGGYTVTYRLKVDRSAAGSILTLPVLLHPMNLLARVVHYEPSGEEVFFQLEQLTNQVVVSTNQLQGATLPSVNAYFTVSANFSVTTLGAYEFPGLSASGGVTIWLDTITVEQRNASLVATLPVVWSSA